ncbi:MAG: hypothetical protein HYZ37_16475 [Candidatus Solibacter usitatus]|nr:hypothetical protein [Candidatus Solibacter usitatus]
MKICYLLCAAMPLCAQDLTTILSSISRQTEKNAKITGLRFNCAPKDCRVKPFEHIPVQVLVDGELPASGNDQPKKGRIRISPGAMKVVETNGGAVSKPFKFQGEDPGGFVESGSAFRSIAEKIAGDYIVFDTFLYVAPEQPGTYTLENDTQGVKGQVKITVAADAPSVKKPEEATFEPEDKSNEPYRALVEHYAPFYAQETWFQPKADIPTRSDFDKDLIGDNNWDNLDKGTSQAYVYYAVMETATHWFLQYNVWHPRDYSDKCVIGSCHENDNEGLTLTIQKDGSQFGKLVLMETLAHDNVYAFTNDSGIRGAAHGIEGRIELFEESHPVVFVESGGHGQYGTTKKTHSRYTVSKDQFDAGTGITFLYKGVAERPRHANDRKVGYELLPILTHWWPRAAIERDQKMFDAFATYQPAGGRPGMQQPRIGMTFYGRKQAANKAKPFWGWQDNKTLKNGILAVGQWGLDPAYAFTRVVRSSAPVSTDYIYNPYLGVSTPVITPGTPAVTAPSSGGILPSLGPAPSAAAQGQIDIDVTVDGSLVFHIRGSNVTPEVLSGQPASNLQVQADALPGDAPSIITIQKTRGRGEVKIVEQPSPQNGMTLKVRVDDPSRGADRYVFRVTWKRSN